MRNAFEIDVIGNVDDTIGDTITNCRVRELGEPVGDRPRQHSGHGPEQRDAKQHRALHALGEERNSPGTTPTSFLFTDQRSEMGEVGLYYYGARWFDPVLARWTSPDPIIPDPYNPSDWDRYSYVRNNPYYHS